MVSWNCRSNLIEIAKNFMMTQKTIYLDYNTTTPMAGAVRQAMQPFLNELFVLPGNLHWKSRAVEEAIEDSRNQVCNTLDCLPSEVIFTRNGTESINLALLGYALAIRKKTQRFLPHLITSTMESETVRRTTERLQRRGWHVSRVACDSTGRIDPSDVAKLITKRTRIISIQWANADIGTIQDISTIGNLDRPNDCVFHCDAISALGKIRTQLPGLGIDLLSLSGHHAYGPKGVGVLFVRNGVSIRPLFNGAWQEGGLAPGAENIPAIVGFGAAMELIQNAGMELGDRMETLANRFYDRLRGEIGDAIGVNGPVDARVTVEDPFMSKDQAKKDQAKPVDSVSHAENLDLESGLIRLPNTLSLVMKDRDAQQLLIRTPELHLGYSDAYSDQSARMIPYGALEATGVTPRDAASTIRVSLGWNTTEEEIDQAVQMLSDAYRSSPEMVG
jgi:cysteine desulfurase